MSARFTLEMRIASARNLKNVNVWRGGALKPYAAVWVRGGSKWITKVGVFSGNSYSWKEAISIQVTTPMEGSILHIDFFHESALEDDTEDIWAGSAQLDLGRLKREIHVEGIPALRTEKVMLGSTQQGEVAVHVRIREVGSHVDDEYDLRTEGFHSDSEPIEY